MVTSKKRKRKIRKLANWRVAKPDGNFFCTKCKKKIKGTVHHFFCNKCWIERQEKIKGETNDNGI